MTSTPSIPFLRVSAARLSAALLAWVLAAACAAEAPDERPAPGITTRDSAGVTIVEATAEAVAALPTWRLADSPTLTIGEVDGDPPYLFTRIRAVLPLGDGEIAVVDDPTREIRVFDASGRFVRGWGGVGDGPGEFSGPPTVRSHRDGGVVAFDPGRSRVTVFDAEGRVSGGWAWDPGLCSPPVAARGAVEAGTCATRGVLGNGSLVLWSEERVIGSPSTDGREFAPDGFVALGAPGEYRLVTRIALPSVTVRRTAGRDGTPAYSTSPPLLSGDPVVTVGSESFVVAYRDRYELAFFDAEGRLGRILRVALPDQPITAGERSLLSPSGEEPVEGIAAFRPKIAATGVVLGEGGAAWVRLPVLRAHRCRRAGELHDLGSRRPPGGPHPGALRAPGARAERRARPIHRGAVGRAGRAARSRLRPREGAR